MTPLPDHYLSAKATEKLDMLWERVVAGTYEGDLPSLSVGLDSAKLLSKSYNRRTIEHASDELPEGRRKLIHPFGSVARVRLRVVNPRSYTGLFAGDSVGLVRFSDGGGGTKDPSFALKLPVDGQRSRNLLANLAVHTDDDNPHPLSLPLSSSTPEPERPELVLLSKPFDAAAKAAAAGRLRAIYQPLLPLAGVTQGGEPIEAPQAPDRVEWRPTDEARAACVDRGDWRLGFAEIPEGTTLYRLHVASVPEATPVPWAELILTSRFVASRYGDEKLFFQHHPH